ncbi:MAG: hypothetical protein ACFUZC_22650 [Chthoniobacteraceae bacterium]
MDALPKIQIVIATLLCLCATLGANEHETVPEPLILQAYPAPMGIFVVPDPASKTGGHKLAPGVKPISDNDPRPDVKDYLMRLGIPFPTGSEAVYEEKVPCVILRQTQVNLDLIEQIFIVICDGLPPQVQCEVSAFRVPESSAALLPKKGNLTPHDLKQLETSGNLLDRQLCVSLSGQEAKITQQKGDSSSRLQVQPVIGADANTTDLLLNYQLKFGRDKKQTQIAIKNKLQIEDGHSVLLNWTTDAQKRAVAIVVRVTIVNSCGWPISEAYSDAPKPRESAK